MEIVIICDSYFHHHIASISIYISWEIWKLKTMEIENLGSMKMGEAGEDYKYIYFNLLGILYTSWYT